MRLRGRVRAVLACALAAGLALPASGAPPLLGGGATVRVSTGVDGREPPGWPHDQVAELSVSADGRFVVFYSVRDLGFGCVKGTYLRDLETGRLELVSVPVNGCHDTGVMGSDASYTGISADGRYVVFTSAALDLVRGRRLPERSPTGAVTLQVFLRDRVLGRTVLVSEGFDGRPANGSAYGPTVSDDGRFVAFQSPATNLVRGDRGNPDDTWLTEVYVRDLHRGVTRRVGPEIRSEGRGPKFFPSISGNGRYVVFEANDGHLVPHKGTGAVVDSDEARAQVYVWDRVSGVTELVSRNDAGYAADFAATLTGYTGSKISRDGRWITFLSQSTNLTGPNFGLLHEMPQVYLFDRVAKKTTRVTNGLAGESGISESQEPCISADGRYVAFGSAASNLGDVDTTPGYWASQAAPGADVYVYDRVSKRSRLVSRATSGQQGDRPSLYGCPSDGATTVVFLSHATNLVPGDTNDVADVFVRRYPAGAA